MLSTKQLVEIQSALLPTMDNVNKITDTSNELSNNEIMYLYYYIKNIIEERQDEHYADVFYNQE